MIRWGKLRLVDELMFNLAGVRWRIGTLRTLTRPMVENGDQFNLILSIGSLMRFSTP